MRVNLLWGSTHIGGAMRNDIQGIYNRYGFVNYITKELALTNFDKLDVENLHLY
jgi:hypothetical protein